MDEYNPDPEFKEAAEVLAENIWAKTPAEGIQNVSDLRPIIELITDALRVAYETGAEVERQDWEAVKTQALEHAGTLMKLIDVEADLAQAQAALQTAVDRGEDLSGELDAAREALEAADELRATVMPITESIAEYTITLGDAKVIENAKRKYDVARAAIRAALGKGR